MKINSLNKTIQFSTVFVLFLLINLKYFDGQFHYDGLQYYNLSKKLGAGLSFTPTKFFIGFRGYLFPLVLNILFRTTSILTNNDAFIYCIFSAAFFSFAIIIALPKTIKTVFKYELKFSTLLIFILFVTLFWAGYFYQPLADFFAIIFILYALLNINAENKYNIFWGGVAIAIAINLRPSYQYCLLLLVLYKFCIALKNKFLKKQLVNLSFYLLGIAIVLAPQTIFNYHCFKTMTPFANTNLKYGNAKTITLFHLSYGLKYFKYETLLRNERQRVVYEVPQNLQVIPFSKTINSINEYFSCTVKKPINAIYIYAVHFFAGLFQTSNQAYINSLNVTNLWYIVLNTILFYLFFLSIFATKQIVFAKQNWLFISVVVLATITAIPTIIEVRYFLLLHLCIYGIIIFGFESGKLRALIKSIKITKHLFLIGILFLGFYFFAVQLNDWVQIY